MNPPPAAPSENPQNMLTIAVARNRRGVYSEVMEMAFGMTPPNPNPVASRKSSSACSEPAVAVSRPDMPNNTVHRTRTGLRPQRSASGPNSSAPSMIPRRPLENTGPSEPRARCNC